MLTNKAANGAQRLRYQRFGMSIATFIVALLATVLITSLGIGQMDGPQWATYVGIGLLGVGIFSVLFYTNINLRFSEKSLAREQIVFWCFWGLIAVHWLPEARPIILMFFLAPFSFGILIFTLRQYFSVVVYVMGLYAALLCLEYFLGPHEFNMQYQLFLFVLFGMLLTWFAFFGGYVSNIRRRLRGKKEELQSANEKIKIKMTERERMQAEKDKLIVELKEALNKEEALIRAKAASDQANIAKSEFLANMSHELRTPLNHIIGFTELVLGRDFGELNLQQEEFLKDVVGSGNHLLSLINEILDLSKVEAGKIELEYSKVKIKALLENSMVIIKEKAVTQNIRLKVDFDDLPDVIVADERKMKQVIYNLLSNAVKFTPAGGEVRLGAEIHEGSELEQIPISTDGTGKWLFVWVSDTGIGIAQQDIVRIFDPFEQVEGSKSRKFQGTGLGLSLARTMVEMHSGAIWATSGGTDKGSTFRFAIPIRSTLRLS